MKNTFIKSTIILSIAALISKVLGSLFRIPLQNIAGDEVLGIFTLVYPVYMVALTLSVAGIPIAISKLIAEARAKNDAEKVREIFLTSSVLASLFGLLSFILIYSFSGYIAEVLGGPSTRLALIVVTGTLLIAPYMAVYRGFFQGHGNMTPTALSQVLEQFIRVGFILAAAYLMVNRLYASEDIAGGIMIGSIIGAAASLIYLRISFVKSQYRVQKSGKAFSWPVFKKLSKTILKISIPICIGAITMALLNLADSISVPTGLKAYGNTEADINSLYGIYGRGLALVQIVTVFATSIVLPLIPAISAKITKKDSLGTKRIMEDTFFLTHLISWPAAIGLFVLTLPINLALFGDFQGSNILAVISLSSVFTSLTVLSTGILQGIGKEKMAAWIIMGGVLVKLGLNFFLVNSIGLIGAAISTLVVYLLIFFTNLYFIGKYESFYFVSRKIVVVIVSSIIMGAIIGIPMLFLEFGDWSRLAAFGYLAISAVIGAIIYFGLLIAGKAADSSLLAKVPVVGRFFN
ncbi:putative polysaccharide biosynthesis protein [Jeotgalibacillus proteolyticus]|nr:polysaccharide biosynthesis protein [Jeotgalibacillus proteolyticus]